MTGVKLNICIVLIDNSIVQKPCQTILESQLIVPEKWGVAGLVIACLLLLIWLLISFRKGKKAIIKIDEAITESDLRQNEVTSHEHVNPNLQAFKQDENLSASTKEVISDHVSELKTRISKLEEQIQEKDKFLSIIAHDLKNPFNNLLGLSELLKQHHATYDFDKRDKLISEIHDSSLYLFEFVNNLLMWSRSQQGTTQFNPDNHSLKDIFEINRNLLQPQASGKEIQLSFEAENEDELIFCDINLLNTILRNLISNAIKFTPHHGQVKVSCKVKEETFLFSVEDNGIGIDQNTIPKLFNVDESFTSQGTDNEQGTGMGLIICKEFVEIHKGEIWVESQAQKGTKFFFTIPFKIKNN